MFVVAVYSEYIVAVYSEYIVSILSIHDVSVRRCLNVIWEHDRLPRDMTPSQVLMRDVEAVVSCVCKAATVKLQELP